MTYMMRIINVIRKGLKQKDIFCHKRIYLELSPITKERFLNYLKIWLETNYKNSLP